MNNYLIFFMMSPMAALMCLLGAFVLLSSMTSDFETISIRRLYNLSKIWRFNGEISDFSPLFDLPDTHLLLSTVKSLAYKLRRATRKNNGSFCLELLTDLIEFKSSCEKSPGKSSFFQIFDQHLSILCLQFTHLLFNVRNFFFQSQNFFFASFIFAFISKNDISIYYSVDETCNYYISNLNISQLLSQHIRILLSI